MNNYFKRLLSMVLAVAMMISSFTIPVGAGSLGYGSNNEVISGSAIDVQGFESEVITEESEFVPDYDAFVGDFKVTGYYSMNNITLLGSGSRPAAIASEIGGYSYTDGTNFTYSARTLGATTQEGGFIAFATDRAAEVKVYAAATGAGRSIGIMSGIPGAYVQENDLEYAAYADTTAPTIYEFDVTEGGQYSIAVTDGFDISKVVVTPLEEDEVIITANATPVAQADANTVSGTLAVGSYKVSSKKLVTDDTSATEASGYYASYPQSSAIGVRNSSDPRYLIIIPAVDGTITLTLSTDKGIAVYPSNSTYDGMMDGASASYTSSSNTSPSFSVTANTAYYITSNSTSNTNISNIVLASSSTTPTNPTATFNVSCANDATVSYANIAVDSTVLTAGTMDLTANTVYTITSADPSAYTISSVTLDSTTINAEADGASYKVTAPSASTCTIDVVLEKVQAPSTDCVATITGDIAIKDNTGNPITITSGSATLTQGATYTVESNDSTKTLTALTVDGTPATVTDGKATITAPTAATTTIEATLTDNTSVETVTFADTINFGDVAVNASITEDLTVANGKAQILWSDSTTASSQVAVVAGSQTFTTADGNSVTAANYVQTSGTGSTTKRAVAIKTGATAGDLYITYASGGSGDRALTISDGTTTTTDADNVSNATSALKEVKFTGLSANTTYYIYSTAGSVRIYFIGSTAALDIFETAATTAPLTVNVTNNSSLTDITGLIVKAALSTDETQTVTATSSDNKVYTFAELAIDSTYKFIAEGLTGLGTTINAVFTPESKLIAAANDAVELVLSDISAAKEYADVTATDNGNGTYTFKFSDTANTGKYAPASTTTTGAVTASVDTDTNNVQYTASGAVLTDNDDTAQVLYMPLNETVSGNKKITVSGTFNVSNVAATSSNTPAFPVVKVARADGTGISIRYSDGSYLIRDDNASTKDISNSTYTTSFTGAITYSITLDLSTNKGSITLDSETKDFDISTTNEFTQITSGTGSTVTQVTTLGDVTYQIEEVTAATVDVTANITNVDSVDLTDLVLTATPVTGTAVNAALVGTDYVFKGLTPDVEYTVTGTVTGGTVTGGTVTPSATVNTVNVTIEATTTPTPSGSTKTWVATTSNPSSSDEVITLVGTGTTAASSGSGSFMEAIFTNEDGTTTGSISGIKGIKTNTFTPTESGTVTFYLMANNGSDQTGKTLTGSDGTTLESSLTLKGRDQTNVEAIGPYDVTKDVTYTFSYQVQIYKIVFTSGGSSSTDPTTAKHTFTISSDDSTITSAEITPAGGTASTVENGKTYELTPNTEYTITVPTDYTITAPEGGKFTTGAASATAVDTTITFTKNTEPAPSTGGYALDFKDSTNTAAYVNALTTFTATGAKDKLGTEGKYTVYVSGSRTGYCTATYFGTNNDKDYISFTTVGETATLTISASSRNTSSRSLSITGPSGSTITPASDLTVNTDGTIKVPGDTTERTYTFTLSGAGEYKISGTGLRFYGVTYDDGTTAATDVFDISGTVTDNNGKAVADITVELKDSTTGAVIDTTTTNTSGAYKFMNVPMDADYTISTVATKDYQSASTNILAADATADITGKNMVLTTYPGSVKVTVTLDGEAVTNNEVTLVSKTSDTVYSATTDSTGVATFGSVKDDTYTVNVIGHAETSQEVIVASDAKTVDFAFETVKRNVTINFTNSTEVDQDVTIKDADGNVIDAETVLATNTSGSPLAVVLELPDGAYSFSVAIDSCVADPNGIIVTETDTTFPVDIKNRASSSFEPLKANWSYVFGTSAATGDTTITTLDTTTGIDETNTFHSVISQGKMESSGLRLINNGTIDTISFYVESAIEAVINVSGKKLTLTNSTTGEKITVNTSDSTIYTLSAGIWNVEPASGPSGALLKSITTQGEDETNATLTLTLNAAGVTGNLTVQVDGTTVTPDENGNYVVSGLKMGDKTITITDDNADESISWTPKTVNIPKNAENVAATIDVTVKQTPIKVLFKLNDTTDVASDDVTANSKKYTLTTNPVEVLSDAQPGDTITITSSSAKIYGIQKEITATGTNSVMQDSDLLIGSAYNKSSTLTFKVPANAVPGDEITLTFLAKENIRNTADLTSHEEGGDNWTKTTIPVIGYGQYAFSGTKIKLCNKDARRELDYQGVYLTFADLGSISDVTGILPGTAYGYNGRWADYIIGDKSSPFTIPDGSQYYEDYHYGYIAKDQGYIQFTIDSNLETVEGVAPRILIDANGQGTTASTTTTKMVVTEVDTNTVIDPTSKLGTKRGYEVTPGYTYKITCSDTSAVIVKSVRLFDPNNIFTKAAVTEYLGTEGAMVGSDVGTKLGFVDSSSTKAVYRLIGSAAPKMSTGTLLSAALSDVQAVGWKIIPADLVDTYNNTYADQYQVGNGVMVDETSDLATWEKKTDNVIYTTDMLNTGVIKLGIDDNVAGEGRFNNVNTNTDTSKIESTDLLIGRTDHTSGSDRNFDVAYSQRFVRLNGTTKYYAIPFTMYSTITTDTNAFRMIDGAAYTKAPDGTTAADWAAAVGAVVLDPTATN